MAKRAAVWGSAYFVAVTALVGFVSSAMLSIEGSVTGKPIFLFLSLVALVVGICLLFVSWFFLNLISQVVYSLRSIVDVIAKVEKGTSEDKSIPKTSQERAGDA